MKESDEKITGEHCTDCRRRFLQVSGGILCALISARDAEGAGKDESEFKPLDKNDRLDFGNSAEEMIQTAYDLGYTYEQDHRGCARCTVAALQDALTFVPDDKSIFRAASCLDGGATPTKLANCGAFTGAGMVIGWLCGTERFGDNTLSHDLIHELHKQFETEYSSVICNIVREKCEADCPDVVGKAACWTAEILLRQFTNYS
jgi:hypothetical protein